MLPLLSPEYHAFALTQRGHGDSDKPECCYTVDDYAADVDAFMDALGIERATVVGGSTGALFAQRAVLSYPHRVSRLALIAAQTPANEIISGFRQEVRAGRSRSFRVRQGVPGEHDLPSGPGRIPCDGGLREPQASGPHLARLHGRGVLSIDREYMDELREIDVPTLILWGSRTPSSRAKNKSGSRRRSPAPL